MTRTRQSSKLWLLKLFQEGKSYFYITLLSACEGHSLVQSDVENVFLMYDWNIASVEKIATFQILKVFFHQILKHY